MEWMNILSNHLPTLDNMASSRKNSMEHAQSTSSSFEVNTNLNTSTEEKQQQQAWMKRSPEMNTPLIHSNAKTSFMGGTTRVELSENATFIPPMIGSQHNSFHTDISSTLSAAMKSTSCANLNVGTLDMFKSSMAAAKLADRVVCDLCKKELCNKYFLRTHKIKVHGLSPAEVGGPAPRSSLSKLTLSTSSDESTKINTYTSSPYPYSNLMSVGSDFLPPPPPLTMPPHFGFPQLLPQLPAPLGGLPMPVPWLPLMTPSTSSEDVGLSLNATKMPSTSPPREEARSPCTRLKEEEFQWDKENTSLSKGDHPMSMAVQLIAANALVICPLCEKTIGPRLFLPTHLTSAHGLSPTDPTFFIFILSARSVEGKFEGKEGDIRTTTSTPISSTTPTTAINESMNKFSTPPSALPFANSNLVLLRSTAPQTSFTASTEGMDSMPSCNRETVPTLLPFMDSKLMQPVSG